MSVITAEARRLTRGQLTTLAITLSAVLVVSIAASTGLGHAAIAPGDVVRYLTAGAFGGTLPATDVTPYTIVWEIRAPRALLAAIAGAGLTMTGILIQVLVRNALADPFILGVSAGASVGASSVVSFGVLGGLGIWALSGAAFAGALTAAALVWIAAGGRATGPIQPLRLVLVGVVLAIGFQALMSLIVFFAPRGDAARTVLFWLLGSLGAARWDQLLPAGIAVLACWWYAVRHCAALDVLSMGDDSATSLGLDVTRLRRRLFFVTALVAGALVAVCGAIGFVGLVVPHVVRLWLGPSHRPLLLVAPLIGALFCVWADVLCRVLVPPRELPLGVLTALVGVPVFIAVIRRRGYVFGSN